ncbi:MULTISPECIES: sensor histidine kinase [Streptomyces]|uniref:sensor histidine kinase n=1 Tax=Streptomyces TaxID=1883 RepID=UPI00081EE571|nr:sensor histidine kinase [Streptomyces sp. PpalLS-921]SCE34518.1 Signal transduction histidine kinase [Streptomyces sp. PpalLS-921]
MDSSAHATPVATALRLCLHALLIGLLALVVVRAVTEGVPHGTAVVVLAAVMAALYGAGAPAPFVQPYTRAAAGWLAALGALWLALLAVSPDALWVAFPLYFLQLHLLPVRWGLPAVVVTAAAAITSFVLHGQGVTPGTFIGPLLGAAVAVATVLGYDALFRESERRRELIEELVATRAELAAAGRTAGTLAERERLAREIHDTLAQGLSSIHLLLRAAERTLPEDAPAVVHVRRAREAAQENLAEARRFVRALSPPDLEHGSLAAALSRLASRTTTPDLSVRCAVSGTPVELPTPYEVALLRTAQSALANTVRHSGARRAGITLSFMETSVSLDVVDDGRGFDPSAPRGDRGAGGHEPGGGGTDGPGTGGTEPSGGFGLPAMRARARSLGGTLSVESAPGQGTAVAVTLPLPAAVDQEDAA